MGRIRGDEVLTHLARDLAYTASTGIHIFFTITTKDTLKSKFLALNPIYIAWTSSNWHLPFSLLCYFLKESQANASPSSFSISVSPLSSTNEMVHWSFLSPKRIMFQQCVPVCVGQCHTQKFVCLLLTSMHNHNVLKFYLASKAPLSVPTHVSNEVNRPKIVKCPIHAYNAEQ